MNKTLQALMTKLRWQCQELDKQLIQIQHQLDQLDAELVIAAENITKACATPAHLLPEQEVARLNFMICQQQTQDELTTCKKELLSQQTTLLARKRRLDTESNMLRNYEDQQKEVRRKQALVNEQNALDEWVLQQGEPA